MYEATILLSSSSLPTQGDLRLAFLGMLTFLHNHQRESSLNNIVNAIYNKLETYWNMHLSNSSAISAILDPRYKFTTFNNPEERRKYIDHLQILFTSYTSNSYIISNVIKEKTQDPRSYFLNMINNNNNQDYSFINNSDFSKIDEYLNTPNDINANPLMW